jgi:hypothetical protein
VPEKRTPLPTTSAPSTLSGTRASRLGRSSQTSTVASGIASLVMVIVHSVVAVRRIESGSQSLSSVTCGSRRTIVIGKVSGQVAVGQLEWA